MGAEKGLIKGFDALTAIMTALGTLALIAVIYLLMIGATVNTATSGDIAVSSTINSSINAVETNVSTGVDSIWSSTTVIIGLIVLVVLLTVFTTLGILKLKGSGKGKGGMDSF